MMEKGYDDKRDFLRMEMDVEVNYRIRGSERGGKGVCKNLSHAGMQMVVGEEIAEGALLEVNVDLGDKRFRPMHATLKVLRVTTLPEGKFLVAGRLRNIE